MAMREAAKEAKRKDWQGVAACFDSAQEYRRWHELLLLERAGKIERLERQLVIKIEAYGEHMWNVEPDFAYFENGVRVYDDCKGRLAGFEYRIFKHKWKLAKAMHRNAEWRVNGVKWSGN